MRLESGVSLLAILLPIGLSLPAIPLHAQDKSAPEALDVSTTLTLDQLAARVASDRVVFIGETHDRYDHHLNQLELIKRLHQMHQQLVIGVEYFQQPFQQAVDDYIAGKIDETAFLRATEYFQRWGYDYRLYAPIFRYAREQHIAVRALNVPTALTSAVVRVGVSGLTEQQRAYLPKQIVPADEAYRDRLQKAFEAHGPAKPGDFDHFVEAQLVWDEGMAEAASTYLNAHPEVSMVVLAGSGHLQFGSGIPQRVERRTHATFAIVINNEDGIAAPHMADYLLFTQKETLPPAGVLGVRLTQQDGHCLIHSVERDSAAAKAGLKKGEIIADIDDQTIAKVADTRLMLWNKKPGDRVRVGVRREHSSADSRLNYFEIELAAPAKQQP
jgi:uncharacterized iron-regulated protein